MKKLVYLVGSFIAFSMFIACSGDNGLPTKTVTPYKSGTEQTTSVETTKLPTTRVFVQGTILDDANTRSELATTRDYSYGDLHWPKSNPEEGWETARFSIRIDGSLPGVENQSSTKYWGGFEGPNLGKIKLDYNYGKYNDRDLDYFKRDTKTGENIGLFRYVYDPDGIKTVDALLQIPDVLEILNYWLNKETNQSNKELLSTAIAKLENNEVKVLWYVVKEVGMRYGWHVNGILTANNTENVLDIPNIGNDINNEVNDGGMEEAPDPPAVDPNNVEVDIHLQEHQDWNEIKVSTHIRTDAGGVTINMPIKYENIIEQDDFAIRFYDYYLKEYPIVPEITHNDNGITISILNIDPALIQGLKDAYGDGLTVEVHSYTKSLDEVWTQLKQSTVTTEKDVTIAGQITTAFDENDGVDF